MLMKFVACAFARCQRFVLMICFIILSFQSLASSWVVTTQGVIPIPQVNDVAVQPYYQSNSITFSIAGSELASAVYYQLQGRANGMFDDSQAWQCVDEASLRQNNGILTINNIADGLYRIKAVAVMAQSQCRLDEFNAGGLVRSEEATSDHFLVADGTDLKQSTLLQPDISSYDLRAYWPPMATAESYKLAISKDNVWHYFDISAYQYNSALSSGPGWNVVDSYDEATQTFTPYTGFGQFKMAVSYCFDDVCSLPVNSISAEINVKPTFDITSTAVAIADDYATKVTFETDSRTPRFKFYHYIEYSSAPGDFSYSQHAAIAPDAQTSFVTTNNGRTIAYERVMSLPSPGKYEMQIQPCTLDDVCQDAQSMGPYFTIDPDPNRLSGGIDPFNPQYNEITGWVKDSDQHPEKVRLYHNGQYIPGSEVATTTGDLNDRRYFVIGDLERLLTDAGINIYTAFTLELRALNWPSTSYYERVQTFQINQFFNSAPTAMPDAVFALDNNPITINVLANDSDPENNQIMLDGYSTYSAAGIEITNRGHDIIYIPDPNFTADIDTFTYSIRDEYGSWSNTATVSVIYSNIMAVEDVGELKSDGASLATMAANGTFNRSMLTYTATIDVLANDEDLLQVAQRVEIVQYPEQGSIWVDKDNLVHISYMGPPVEPICFLYRVITISGAASNVAKSCAQIMETSPLTDRYTIAINRTSFLDVLKNDIYVAKDSDVELLIGINPAHGDLDTFHSYTQRPMFIYRPDSNFAGDDSFTYGIMVDGKKSYFVTVNIRVGDITPAAPANITAIATDDTSIDVAFDGSSHSTSYQLQHFVSDSNVSVSSISNGSWLPVIYQSELQREYNLTDLAYGYHYFRVKACSNVGITCSGWVSTSSPVHLSDSSSGGGSQPDTENLPSFAWPTTQDVASARVGTLAGSFRVSESGSATYNIPVAMPAGIAGVTPQVSISYNSMAGNGVIGSGWQLQAVSGISRCRQTYETDYRYQAIALDNSDRFCLDGQRLVAVSGSNGANNTVYKTEVYSDLRITSKNTQGNGPKYFTVEAPDGSISYYGHYNTTHNATIKADDDTIVSWMIVKTVDNMGRVNSANTNAITYTYQTVASNELLIDYIEYSGNKIDFSYSARSDSSLVYSAGMAMESTQRLDTITISNHSNSAINSYHLDYTPQTGMANDLTRLNSITQCDGALTGVCLPATTFEWSKSTDISAFSFDNDLTVDVAMSVVPMNVDDDGLIDTAVLNFDGTDYALQFLMNLGAGELSADGAPPSITFSHDDTNTQPIIMPVDTDGDGVNEIAVRYQDSDKKFHWRIYTNVGGSYTFSTLLSDKHSVHFTDLTGDGLVDVIYRDYGTSGGITNKILINTGGSFATAVTVPYPTLPATAQTHFEPLPAKLIKASNKSSTVITQDSSAHQELIYGNFVASRVADFNGDGLTDIVALFTTRLADGWEAPDCTVEIYNKNYHVFTTQVDAAGQISFNYYDKLLGTHQVRDASPASSEDDKYECNTADSNSNIFNGGNHFFDINGDGMADVVYQSRSDGAWYVLYSTGIGFTDEVTPTNMAGKIKNITFLDTDADGDAELLYTIEPSVSSDTTHRWYMHENIDGQLATRSTYNVDNSQLTFDASLTTMMFMDVSGDGEAERVIIDYSSNEVKIRGQYNANRASRITSITNGIGNITTIDYKPLTDSTIYTKGSGAEGLDYGHGSPIFDILSPMHVVSETTTNAPSYNADGTIYDVNTTLRTEYAYQGMRIQTGGRGSLGFKSVISYDPQTGVTTDTTYRQDFPYVGMPSRTLTCLDRGLSLCDSATRMLSVSLSFYNDSTDSQPNELHGGDVLVAYPHRQITDSYQLNTDGTTSFINRNEVYNFKSANLVAGYLQVDRTENLVFSTASSSGTPISLKKTINTYNDDVVDNWWINRVSTTQVIENRLGTSNIVRNTEFEYDATTGLLTTEYIEPNSPDEKLYLKTVHTFDDYGNRLSTTQCSLSNATAVGCAKNSTVLEQVYRQTSSAYDSHSRYVTSSGNDLFNVVNNQALNTVVSRNALGQITQSTDINGVNNHALFDSFGQLYASKSDIGQFKKITRRLATEKPATWPSIAEPYVAVAQEVEAGKPVKYTYTDIRGLTVATVSQAFADNKWVMQYNRFDKHGNLVKQSEPFHNGNTIYWSSHQYDSMNRRSSSTTADGVTTASVTYSGLTTSTISHSTNTYGTITQTYSETKNRIGDVVSATDNANNVTTFTYNGSGQAETTTSFGSQTTIVYDAYGRKISTDDPNKGLWTARFNALGEMIEQTSANGFVTQHFRDSVGRVSYKYIAQKDANDNLTFVDQVNNVYSGHQLIEQNRNSNDYRKCLYYDNFGRNDRTTTIFDGRACTNQPPATLALKVYNQSTVFDAYGRVSINYDATGKGVVSHYRNGFLQKQTEASDDDLLVEILTMDARGNVTRSKDGLNVETSRVYDPASGLIESLVSNSGAIQHITYAFDGAGNLRYKNNESSKIEQNFLYDNLNRLERITGFMPQTVHYEANGNIFSKSDVRSGGTYQYNSSRPHAVTNIGPSSYAYDNNGNQTRATDGGSYVRNVDYSYFNKPTLITMGDAVDDDSTSIDYDSAENRYKRVDKVTESGSSTQKETVTYYIGNVEVSQVDGGTIYVKRYVANAIQTTGNNGTNSTRYTYKDHLGSLDAVVNEQKHIESKLYFDPWGKRVALSKSQLSSQSQAISLTTLIDSIASTNRGFTGHESIDHTGVIHMNGRIYDPTLGRFLQADPFVQAPKNSQSYNRYSYVMNNPMNYTDPSGYLFKGLFKKIASVPLLNTIITVALSIYCQACLVAYNALSTYALTGNWGAAFVSGLMTAVAPGGQGFEGFMTSALLGGVASKLQGGHFGHGFWSAGVGAVAGNWARNFSSRSGQILVGAVIGGTVSKLTGGKFANGAFSAAFAAAISAKWSENADKSHSHYAELSGHTYRVGADENPLQVGDAVGDYKVVEVFDEESVSGLKAALFVDSNENTILAYAGTESMLDMQTNALQGIGGDSKQYIRGMELAKQMVSKYGAVSFTGHSLGGGLASAAAIQTDGTAIIFNAAGLHPNTLGTKQWTDGNIIHYRSGYDAISVINAITRPKVPGKQINVGHASWHDMSSMCEVFEVKC